MPDCLDCELDKKQFGLRLLELRLAIGLSQNQVVERSDGEFRQSHWSQWELGDSAPIALKLPAIAKSLGCSLDDLFVEPKIKNSDRPGKGRPRGIHFEPPKKKRRKD